MHTVLTCEAWEKEFEEFRFDNKFPPLDIYPDEDNRVFLALSSLEKYGGIKLLQDKPVKFNHYRRLIHDSFRVQWTAISRPLEHFLFELSFKLRPQLTLVIGCGYGIALSFLAASLESAESIKSEVIGVDINPDVIALANQNINILNLKNVKVDLLAEDAHQTLDSFNRDIDLLFLDADCKEENIYGKKGKGIYESLILKALPYLHKNSLVLAHDVRWAKLSGEIEEYLSLVRNPILFTSSIEVCFDIQGLEISQKSG